MRLAPGTTIGTYEVVSSLGAGGMGEVYRARDSHLKRAVAIKVLPAALAGDADRLARFQREAEVLAALNHPNIAAVYGLEKGPDLTALVMELVEGEDLSAHIARGALPLAEALPIAKQVADALEAAHEQGIIHRDLKPANIKVRADGTVKVLDFGLAKALETNAPSAAAGAMNSPTLTARATQMGVILGTAAYMAPEQAKGKPVDRRADIWAFGVVLYEMLSGRRLFEAEDVSETLAAVLTRDVSLAPLLAATPAPLRALLRDCLVRDPKLRLRDIGDARRVLDQIIAGAPDDAVPPSTTAAAGGPASSRALLAVVAVLAVALGVALWAPWRAVAPLDRPLVRLDVDLGADVALPATASRLPVSGSPVAISPDGMRLAYISGNPTKLFTRRLDQAKATELPGAQGANAPFFSPDGQWIGFKTGLGQLKKISVEGGAVVPLGEIGSSIHGTSWGEDGSILLGGGEAGLVRIRDGGGQPETVAARGDGDLRLVFPQILPGGKAVLFSAYTALNQDSSSIEVITLADHHRKTVSRGGTSPRYIPSSNGASGHLVYTSKTTLFAVPFDLDKLETRGTAFPVLDDVAFHGFLGTAQLSLSRGGTLVYRRSMGQSLLRVEWLDSAGKTQPLLAKPGVYGRPSLSPDGQRLALEVEDGSGTDIWVYDWRRDTMTRLTYSRTASVPVWSPDGRHIVCSSGLGMTAIRSDGAGKLQPLTQSRNNQQPWSFTADGKRLAFHEASSKTSFDIWTVPIENDAAGLRAGQPEVFLQTPEDERTPAFSPDGRWIAYMSAETGLPQIYVRAFPDKGGKWQISSIGSGYPMWPRSGPGAGRELFFETTDNQVMVTSYAAKGDSFVADKPRVWSEKRLEGGVNISKNLDLAPDGRRIVALMPASEANGAQEERSHVVFLLNFFDELRRRAPAGK